MAKTGLPKSTAQQNNKKKTASPSVPKGNVKIEKRAYEIFMNRISAGTPGSEVSDWLQAESDLRGEEE
jgi:hypothetical protein